MKKIILLLLVVVLTLPTLAQQAQSLFEQLTEKYADKDGFSASQISKDMFDLYLKKKNVEDESPVSEALKNLENIVVVSQSKYGRTAELVQKGYIKLDEAKETLSEDDKELHNNILDHYRKQSYILLKTEKRAGEDVKVYVKKNNDKIESLALVTNSSVSTNLVELKGNIDLKTVSELGTALNLRGLENLYKIDNSNSLGRYSSFGYSSGYAPEKYEEMILRQRELVESQRNLTDEQRAKFEEQAKQMAEKQLQMAEKYREMAEKYRRQPIFLSAPGDTNTVYYLNGKKVNADKIKELDQEKIESVKVNKAEKENDKTTVRITTK